MTLQAVQAPHFVGNNLALDFLNSAFGTGEHHYDCLADDAGALAWLQAAGQLTPAFDGPAAGLAALARALRAAGARLIDAGRARDPGDLALVNQILEQGQPVRALVLDAQGQVVLTERRRNDHLASLLEPVAAALGHLLAGEALLQVRQCEAHDCTLRFLDITKSGRRRWCSMAVCGNRMKVAAFRARKDAR